MYKAIKDNKIIAISDTDSQFKFMVKDGVEIDTEHTCENYEQVNGEYVLKEDVPVDVINEQIRQQRQQRYEAESDPIRLDYDEALARGEETAEQLKQDWLASKDKIREELPYIEEEKEEEDGTTDVG